jgi:branched-chain amino acid transport system substrate-binding protein
LNKYLLGFLVAMVVIGLILSGCTTNIASPTSQTNPSTASQPAQPPAEAKTLKIGVAFHLGTSVGLDALHGIELLVAEDNIKGINIGGENYKIELVSYDTEGSQTSEVAAINRLVFQDKVKFIMTVGQFEGAWLATTEENKVLIMSQDMNANVDLAARTRYSFNPTFQDPEITSKMGWFCKTYPDLVKNMITVFVDNQFGHMMATMSAPQLKLLGATATTEFIPAQQVDISSIATKIVTMNPSSVMCMTADSNTDAMAFGSIRAAGYKGQLFHPTNNALATWKNFVSDDVLEGFITGMDVTEPDPALTSTAENYKKLWIKKYGSWTAPTIISTGLYPPLIAALEKAGSLDTDKVSDALAGGLEFSSPTGDGKMISRPDLGNNRTVDSISTYYMKQIVDGKIKLLATISPDEALKFFQIVNPPLPAGATPSAGGPPGGGPPGGDAPPPAP